MLIITITALNVGGFTDDPGTERSRHIVLDAIRVISDITLPGVAGYSTSMSS